jgi:tRNA-specific 2-thiouridylase
MAVRIRHRHRPVEARLVRVDGERAELRFVGRGPLVTPGQAAVFYRDELVLGGGWIVGESATDLAEVGT